MSDRVSVVIALGSNLGNRVENLRRALDACTQFMEIERESRIYDTLPMYLSSQPNFLNMAIAGYYEGGVRDLLAQLQEAESAMGRRSSVRYGPRLIDLDIVFFGDLAMESEDLTVPHPLLSERDFVLLPLMDICPDFEHPGLGVSVRDLCSALGSRRVEIYRESGHA